MSYTKNCVNNFFLKYQRFVYISKFHSSIFILYGALSPSRRPHQSATFLMFQFVLGLLTQLFQMFLGRYRILKHFSIAHLSTFSCVDKSHGCFLKQILVFTFCRSYGIGVYRSLQQSKSCTFYLFLQPSRNRKCVKLNNQTSITTNFCRNLPVCLF